jgi:transitional endoplasmic reticulum ATPase
MLIIDEADSLLSDRREAVRSWEVTQVNEMLTWMENHPLPFVCTTNLMDRLDQASLRRFTLKLRFEPLTPAQAALAFEHCRGVRSGQDQRPRIRSHSAAQ